MDKSIDAKKQSVFVNGVGGIDHLNGICVRLAVTMTAIIIVATPFLSIIGIAVAEIPRIGISFCTVDH